MWRYVCVCIRQHPADCVSPRTASSPATGTTYGNAYRAPGSACPELLRHATPCHLHTTRWDTAPSWSWLLFSSVIDHHLNQWFSTFLATLLKTVFEGHLCRFRCYCYLLLQYLLLATCFHFFFFFCILDIQAWKRTWFWCALCTHDTCAGLSVHCVRVRRKDILCTFSFGAWMV